MGGAVICMAGLQLLALASIQITAASVQMTAQTKRWEGSYTSDWGCPQHREGSFPEFPWSANATCVNVTFAGAS